MARKSKICISIVSHGQGYMVTSLLKSLEVVIDDLTQVDVIVTINIPESIDFSFSNLCLKVISNPRPKGFASNHNAAFKLAESEFFCVLNPDVQFRRNPFPVLIKVLKKYKVSVVAPKIVNSANIRQDSARYFPTIINTISRVLGKSSIQLKDTDDNTPYPVDWIGGMFMLFDFKAFKAVAGFDEKFFLYYEDADICTRMWQNRFPVWVAPEVCITHNAQRSSHHNLRYLVWHLKSMFRYFIKHWPNYPHR